MLTLKMDLSEIIRDDDSTESKYRIVEGGRVDLKISSPDCKIFIQASLYKDTTVTKIRKILLIWLQDYDKKTINYSLLLTFMAIINLYSIAKMIKSCVEAPAEANKVPNSCSLNLIFDQDFFGFNWLYHCLGHLYLLFTSILSIKHGGIFSNLSQNDLSSLVLIPFLHYACFLVLHSFLNLRSQTAHDHLESPLLRQSPGT